MSSYQPKNMLVTGGAGFIGANYVRYQLECDPSVKIINLDLLTYAGSLENLKDIPNNDRYHFIKGDICDKALVLETLMQNNIDTIVHFAAESHVDRSITSPDTFINTNITGTFTLLEAARHYWLESQHANESNCRFHHISTDEVYGSLDKNDPPFTETSLYAPNSPYAASKASSDYIVRAYHKTYGLPTTISNCSNNYGPYQHTEKLIPTIIRCCLENKSIPIYGDGSNIRDWLYVDDHCHGIDTILRLGVIGETYNVGGSEEWSNIDLAKLICKKMDSVRPSAKPYESLITFVEDRPGHDWRYAIDSSKLQQLGWKTSGSFEEYLEKTIQFYT